MLPQRSNGKRPIAPHLPLTGSAGGWHGDTSHLDNACVRSRSRIAAGVRAFLAPLTNPVIWAWYSPFNAVALCQLCGPMSDLPARVPACTRDLMQDADWVNVVLARQELAVHHALAGARHDLRIAATMALAEGQNRVTRTTAYPLVPPAGRREPAMAEIILAAPC